MTRCIFLVAFSQWVNFLSLDWKATDLFLAGGVSLHSFICSSPQEPEEQQCMYERSWRSSHCAFSMEGSLAQYTYLHWNEMLVVWICALWKLVKRVWVVAVCVSVCCFSAGCEWLGSDFARPSLAPNEVPCPFLRLQASMCDHRRILTGRCNAKR